MSEWGEKQDAAASGGTLALPRGGPPKIRVLGGGVISVAVAGLLLLAPVALAAPANDDFANAQVVGPLPVGLMGSNEGATKEEGEPYHRVLGSKGHSVWLEWEATSTGFVTVNTCGSDLATALSVYTGNESRRADQSR